MMSDEKISKNDERRASPNDTTLLYTVHIFAASCRSPADDSNYRTACLYWASWLVAFSLNASEWRRRGPKLCLHSPTGRQTPFLSV